MKKIKTSVCFLLVIFCAFMMTGCSDTKSAVLTFTPVELNDKVSTENTDKALYVQDKPVKQMLRISRSDMTTLYFDESNYSVCVYDSNTKKLWRSLPEKYTNEKPAVLSAEILVSGKKYTLNSQDDSVAKGLASYEVKDGTAYVKYGFESKLSDGTLISFVIPVSFAASDGTFTASIDCSSLRNSEMSENVIIKNIRLLEYFGSYTDGTEGDFIFIPDGSGAVIDTSEKCEEFSKITVNTYGADISTGEKSDASASVPAFGMKSGKSSFIALIEDGDAVSHITAQKALKKTSYNKVGAYFDITKTVTDKESGTVTACAKSYDGNIKISYRLLSDDNATYVGMAGACREMLIRNGTFDMQETAQNTGNMPFMLKLIATAKVGEKGKTQVLTDFEQAKEILSFLRSKGIGNAVVNYSGIFTNRSGSTDVSKLKLSGKLGSSKQLDELAVYAKTQNITLFASADIISAGEKNLKNKAAALNGGAITLESTVLKNKVISSSCETAFAAAGEIKNNTNLLISKLRDYPFDGVCLENVGKYLYSDNSINGIFNRQQTQSIIASQSQAITSSEKLMVSGGNIYTLKYADYVTDLPMSASVADRDYCKSVPFLQAVLHGVLSYTGTAVNLSSDTEKAMLKAVEYGCLPSYEFYYSDFGTEKNKDSYNYINGISEAQSSYERMSETLYDLGSKKITAHYAVKSGVYCTEYDGNTSVYVNYNKTDKKVNGVTVEARSFIRVN